MTRRLRLLIALAGLGIACAACGPTPDDVAETEAAITPPSVSAQADAVWRYYLGATTIPRPSVTMFQPDINCSPQALGGGKYAFRIPRFFGSCLSDAGSQNQTAPYSFWATYEIWQNHVPDVQQPFYATLAIPFLCMAAYKQSGFSYAAAYPYCSGAASSTVPAVRRWVHDTFYAGTPFWQ